MADICNEGPLFRTPSTPYAGLLLQTMSRLTQLTHWLTGEHWGQSSCPMRTPAMHQPPWPPGMHLFLEEVGLEVGLGVGLRVGLAIEEGGPEGGQAGRSPKLAAVEPVPVL